MEWVCLVVSSFVSDIVQSLYAILYESVNFHIFSKEIGWTSFLIRSKDKCYNKHSTYNNTMTSY